MHRNVALCGNGLNPLPYPEDCWLLSGKKPFENIFGKEENAI